MLRSHPRRRTARLFFFKRNRILIAPIVGEKEITLLHRDDEAMLRDLDTINADILECDIDKHPLPVCCGRIH